jgi:hypothetical protein
MDKDKELTPKELKNAIKYLKEHFELPNGKDTPLLHQKQILKSISLSDLKKIPRILIYEFSDEAISVLFCEEQRDKLDLLLDYAPSRIPLYAMDGMPKKLIIKKVNKMMLVSSKEDVEFVVNHADDIFNECFDMSNMGSEVILALMDCNRFDIVARILKAPGKNSLFQFFGKTLAERDNFSSIAKVFFENNGPYFDAIITCIKKNDVASILIALDYRREFTPKVEAGLFNLNNPRIIDKWIHQMCVKGGNLSKQSQILLMNPIYKDAIKRYVGKYHSCLCEEAEIKLIGLKDEEITKLYLSKVEELCPVAEELLFSLYPSRITSIYEIEAGLSLSKEREMILKNYPPVINAYIHKHELYNQNEALFFKTCSDEIRLKYIELHDLADYTDACIMKYCPRNIVEARIKFCIERKIQLDNEVEVMFFKKFDKELTAPYLKAFTPIFLHKILAYLDEELIDLLGEVSNSDIDGFISDEKAPCEKILLVSKKLGLTSQHVEKLIRNKRLDVLTKLFEQNKLSDAITERMMETEYLDIIEEYIKHYDLPADAEVKFVKIAPQDLLNSYQERYVISAKAEHVMIKLGLF